MRQAILISAIALLAACSPREKPADVATPIEASQMAAQPGATTPVAVTADSEMPQDLAASNISDSMSGSEDASGGTCLAQVGKPAADRLVKRCIQVSPATHPPCNVQNRCEMIQDEIDRSCAMYGPDEKKPDECAG